jgi:ABC-type Zn uptake system ZnuABC Zn-binding protein ZnuA
MIPALKDKYQAKYNKLLQQLEEVRTSLTQQLEEEKRHSLELESQN